MVTNVKSNSPLVWWRGIVLHQMFPLPTIYWPLFSSTSIHGLWKLYRASYSLIQIWELKEDNGHDRYNSYHPAVHNRVSLVSHLVWKIRKFNHVCNLKRKGEKNGQVKIFFNISHYNSWWLGSLCESSEVLISIKCHDCLISSSTELVIKQKEVYM